MPRCELGCGADEFPVPVARVWLPRVVFGGVTDRVLWLVLRGLTDRVLWLVLGRVTDRVLGLVLRGLTDRVRRVSLTWVDG